MRFHAIVIFVSVIMGIAFSHCKSSEKPASSNSVQSDTVLLASVERTPCFGICPVYKVTIYQSGKVVMHGKRHVPNIGWFTTRLTAQQVNSIIRYASENKVYELNGEYSEPRIADFPTTITELNINYKYKRIVNTQPSAPEVLLNWEKFLDSFFNDSTSWQLMQPPAGLDE